MIVPRRTTLSTEWQVLACCHWNSCVFQAPLRSVRPSVDSWNIRTEHPIKVKGFAQTFPAARISVAVNWKGCQEIDTCRCETYAETVVRPIRTIPPVTNWMPTNPTVALLCSDRLFRVVDELEVAGACFVSCIFHWRFCAKVRNRLFWLCNRSIKVCCPASGPCVQSETENCKLIQKN